MSKEMHLKEIKINNETNRITFDITYKIENDDGSVVEEKFVGVENPFQTCINVEDAYPQKDYCSGDTYYSLPLAYWREVRCKKVFTTIIQPPTVPLEVTMNEVEEKFGRPVKIVKEKS